MNERTGEGCTTLLLELRGVTICELRNSFSESVIHPLSVIGAVKVCRICERKRLSLAFRDTGNFRHTEHPNKLLDTS